MALERAGCKPSCEVTGDCSGVHCSVRVNERVTSDEGEGSVCVRACACACVCKVRERWEE